MTITKTEIDGLWIIDPGVFKDERGYFLKPFMISDINYPAHLDLYRTMKQSRTKAS